MITVDARGENCPVPVIKTKKVLEALTDAEVVEVLVDNEIAVQNVMKLGISTGAEVKSEKTGEKEFKVVLVVNEIKKEKTAAEKVACKPDLRKNTIVVFASENMGEGNDALGKVLMKGFVFALTQLETLPEQMLFYNGGATLTTEGSDLLEDLKAMEVQGVEILTCGTCLDYYGLKERLAVGSVTNMYSIVEAMNQADSILRP